MPVAVQDGDTWRCWNCKRIVTRIIVAQGLIVQEIKCKCNAINTVKQGK